MANPDPNELRTRFVQLGTEYAELDAAASWLEESRKALRAQLAVAYLAAGGSVAKAELLAEADKGYSDHLKAMVEARRKASIARVNFDGAKLWSEMVRTQEASRRAEMTMR